MRLLGILFVVVLAVAIVGYFRGWYFVETVHGAGTREAHVVVDKDKLRDDVGAAADEVGRLSQRAKEIVTGAATHTAAGTLELDAQVVAVDAGNHVLQQRVGDSQLSLHVPSSTPVVIDGSERALANVNAGQSVRVTMRADGDALQVTRIEAR